MTAHVAGMIGSAITVLLMFLFSTVFAYGFVEVFTAFFRPLPDAKSVLGKSLKKLLSWVMGQTCLILASIVAALLSFGFALVGFFLTASMLNGILFAGGSPEIASPATVVCVILAVAYFYFLTGFFKEKARASSYSSG